MGVSGVGIARGQRADDRTRRVLHHTVGVQRDVRRLQVRLGHTTIQRGDTLLCGGVRNRLHGQRVADEGQVAHIHIRRVRGRGVSAQRHALTKNLAEEAHADGIGRGYARVLHHRHRGDARLREVHRSRGDRVEANGRAGVVDAHHLGGLGIGGDAVRDYARHNLERVIALDVYLAVEGDLPHAGVVGFTGRLGGSRNQRIGGARGGDVELDVLDVVDGCRQLRSESGSTTGDGVSGLHDLDFVDVLHGADEVALVENVRPREGGRRSRVDGVELEDDVDALVRRTGAGLRVRFVGGVGPASTRVVILEAVVGHARVGVHGAQTQHHLRVRGSVRHDQRHVVDRVVGTIRLTRLVPHVILRGVRPAPRLLLVRIHVAHVAHVVQRFRPQVLQRHCGGEIQVVHAERGHLADLQVGR